MHTISEFDFCLCIGFGISDSRVLYTDKDRMLLYEGEEHPLVKSIAAELSELLLPCETAPAAVYETNGVRLIQPAPLLTVGTVMVSIRFTDADGKVFDVISGRDTDLLRVRDFLARQTR